jgi:hypothetical protein
MTKSNEIFLFTAAALLAGVFYMAVPGILLSSDFEHGGVQQVLEAVQDSGYNEIRLIAFYAPATALVLFLLFAITLIARNKGSVHIGVICFVFSIWSVTQIQTVGWFGLFVSGGYLY